jgi:hypothetical protein
MDEKNTQCMCCLLLHKLETQEPNTKLNLDYFKRNKLSSTLENLENITKNSLKRT